MNRLLKDCRDKSLEAILAFIWRQWSSVGLAVHVQRGKTGFVDPEALFAMTCAFGRYDARLFDEVLDWMALHARFMNIQRMKNILAETGFAGHGAVNASALALQRATSNAKWRLLARKQSRVELKIPFFLLPDGRPLPLRGKCDPDFLLCGLRRPPVQLRRMSRLFSPDSSPALLLRLRALLGVNARCEILAYLLLNPYGNSHEIARQTHYFQKTIHDTLVDLEHSGYVDSLKAGRERRFRFSSSELRQALMGAPSTLYWVDWPGLLAPIELFWRELDALARKEANEQAVSSELYFMCKRLASSRSIREGAFAVEPPKPGRTPGDYVRTFLQLVQSLE